MIQFGVSPVLGAKAQSHYEGNGSLSFKQPRGQTLAKFLQQRYTFTILSNSNLICGKIRQITHVPSPSSGIAQKLFSRVMLLRQLVGSG